MECPVAHSLALHHSITRSHDHHTHATVTLNACFFVRAWMGVTCSLTAASSPSGEAGVRHEWLPARLLFFVLPFPSFVLSSRLVSSSLSSCSHPPPRARRRASCVVSVAVVVQPAASSQQPARVEEDLISYTSHCTHGHSHIHRISMGNQQSSAPKVSTAHS